MKKLLTTILSSLILTGVAQAKDLRFVQITDARFLSSNSNTDLINVIQDVNKQKDVKFVVFTGDNIDKPSPEELSAFLKEAKKLKCPFYVIAGDREVSKLKEFGKKEYALQLKKEIKRYKPQTPSYTFEKEDVLFIVADGAKDVIPTSNGYYRDNVLSLIEGALIENRDKNVIILQHFPIVPPIKKETYYTHKAEDYLKTISKYDNVKAIFAGHFGVNSQTNVNGVEHITTAPVPYYRIIDIMDCETPTPMIWAQIKKVEE